MTAFQDSKTALETWTDTRNIQEIIDRLVRSALAKTSQGVVRRPITVLHMLEAADTSKMEKHYRQKHSFVTGLPLSGLPTYKFCAEKRSPGGGKTRGSGTKKRCSHKCFHMIFPCTDSCTNTFCTSSPPPLSP